MTGASGNDGRFQLASDEIVVIASATEGGRIVSLTSVKSGVEFLTQSQGSRFVDQPRLDALFRNGPCAGIEECLPTVASCGPETEGGSVPDHGDFWQKVWDVSNVGRTSLSMEALGFSRPLRFKKTLFVEGDTLRISYLIRNEGDAPQSLVYACHPLLAVSVGDRVCLPQEVEMVRVDYSRRNRLGVRGTRLAWPSPTSDIALDLAYEEQTGFADMLYTDRLVTGACSIWRLQSGQSLDMSFSTDALPYLGIWLCYGGWPDDATENLQYAIALEPTTSPFNSLAEAQAAGQALTLAAGTEYAFDICFRVRDLNRADVASTREEAVE